MRSAPTIPALMGLLAVATQLAAAAPEVSQRGCLLEPTSISDT